MFCKADSHLICNKKSIVENTFAFFVPDNYRDCERFSHKPDNYRIGVNLRT